MSLTNIDSSTNELVATGVDGNAVSEPILQQEQVLSSNISIADTADTLLSYNIISQGDLVVIEKIDTTEHELILGTVTNNIGVTEAKSTLTMTTWVSAGQIVSSDSEYNDNYIWNAFNSSRFVRWQANYNWQPNIYWETTADPFVLSEFMITPNSVAPYNPTSWIVYGWSEDLAEWQPIDEVIGYTGWGAANSARYFPITNDISYTKYRVWFYECQGNRIAVNFFKFTGYESIYQADTTIVTAGEIPLIAKNILIEREKDFGKLTDIYSDFEYVNISISTTPDLLETTVEINDGDLLVIVKEDETVVEVIASGVTGTAPYQMDTTAITAGEIPIVVYAPVSAVSFKTDIDFVYPDEVSYAYNYINQRINKVDFFEDGSGIALWQLAGDATEYGGNYTATEVGTVQWLDNNPFNEPSCLYTARNGGLQTDLVTLPTEISISFWAYSINPTSDTGHTVLFAFSRYNGSTTDIFLAISNDQYDVAGDVLRLWADDYGYFRGDTYPIYNAWTHYVVTSTGNLYVNKVKSLLTFPPLDMSTVNRPFLIHAALEFDGNIGDYQHGYGAMCRIFNREVSQTEVNNLYTEELQRYFTKRSDYKRLNISSRSIETKVELKNIGDKCTKVSSNIWKDII